ncbi:MAG: hypothetical protein EB824_05075 [Thaumarchaeota archaeon S15]|nr:MAG: hypothetical protein EB824_05075 [Thaumarchaeota archaeon S15]
MRALVNAPHARRASARMSSRFGGSSLVRTTSSIMQSRPAAASHSPSPPWSRTSAANLPPSSHAMPPGGPISSREPIARSRTGESTPCSAETAKL